MRIPSRLADKSEGWERVSSPGLTAGRRNQPALAQEPRGTDKALGTGLRLVKGRSSPQLPLPRPFLGINTGGCSGNTGRCSRRV